MDSQLSIRDFYVGKSIFVTGGTGFLGKIIIEKLLRSCPAIDNVYMLCRSKKGKNVSERLAELTASPIFDLIRDQNAAALNKIILVEGDVSKIELGLSQADQELLKDKISVVIHSAATISFSEPLKVAVNTNLSSMNELLTLSHQMRNLQALVHISTAFTNWFDIDVKEEVKQTDYDPKQLMAMIKSLSDDYVDYLTLKFLGKHANTYTFTKALAENLALNEAKNIPMAIVKPSMVGACMSEPHVGWIDSVSAMSLYIFLIAKGIFRASIMGDLSKPCDIIPADLVSNMAIAAAWKVATDKSSTKNPQIFSMTSGENNKLQWNDFIATTVDLGRRYPLDTVAWYPKNRQYKSPRLFVIDSIVTQIVPAYLMDIGRLLVGKKAILGKMQTDIARSYFEASFVSQQPYVFRASNFKQVLSSMSENEKKEFNFDPRTIKWKQYLEDYYFGMKKFVLKEKDLSSMAAKRRVTRLKFASYFVTASMTAAALMILGNGCKNFIKNKPKN